jgi:uncharacterized membrane protein
MVTRHTVETKRRIDTYSKNRIEALTDAIFAFAMTLLVVTIEVPKTQEFPGDFAVDQIIFSVFPDFIHYVLAFALLAGFWWYHHKWSHTLHSIDQNQALVNIITLLFVAMVPFTTNLVGNFPLNAHAALLFEVNILLIGLLLVHQWAYLSKNPQYLNENANLRQIDLNKKKTLVFPILSCIGIVLGLLSVPYSALVYAIAPVYLWMMIRKEHAVQES